jgi:microcystin-dependent protein
MSFPTWLSDASANRTLKTYMKDFLDLSGNLYLQNGSIITPMNTISFNDTNGFVNFGNVYFGSAVYIYNPNVSSNIDVVAYVNTNNDNVNYLAGQISDIYDNKIGSLNYDSNYDFTTVNNIYCAGQIQYLEAGTGNHVDIVPIVLSNTSNITTLQTKTSAQGYNSGTTTTSFAGIVECNVVSFLTSINGISTTVFGYISGLTSSAQTQISARVDKTSAETISGVKTFSSNMRLDGSLLLNAGVLTISNATLQKIQFLSTVSSDIQTQVTSLSTKLTNLTFSTPTTSISGTTQLATANVSGNLRLDGSLLLNAGVLTISNATLQKIQFLSTVSSDIQSQTTALQTKLTNLTFSTPTTSISGTTATSTLTFSGTLNSVSSTTFGYISGLTSSAQTQIDNKANLGAFNNFTAGCQFSNQLVSLYNASGTIYGSQTELFLTGHRSWANGGASTLGNNVFEMSLDTGFYKRGLAIQGGESNTNTASAKGSIFGLYYRTFVGSGTEPIRTPIMYGTDLETANGAIDNTLTIPSSLRLYGDLKLFSGDVVTNTQLNYLSTLSENVQSAVNTLKTKLTDLLWTSGSPNVTSIVNTTQTATLTFSNTLNGVSTTIFGYISGLTSSAQTQLTNIVSSITTINSKLPIGMIITHPKNNLASPYLLCNGQAVSRSTYSALFTSIGVLYGSGDGSTTFNLPNFQACFLRGSGTQVVGSTTYSTGSVGTPVNDTVIGHTHAGQSGQFLTTSTSSTTINGYASVAVVKPTSSNFGTTGGVNSSGSGAETAPVHHVIYYYILAL